MKRSFLLSIIFSLTFLTAGFLLLHFELIGYGFSFFVFLPFILGYLLGNSTIKAVGIGGLAVSLVIFLILLFAGELEGMVCILMAMPLVIVATALGVLVERLVKRSLRKREEKHRIKSSLLPLCLLVLVGAVDTVLTKDKNERVSIVTEIVLPFSSMEVYDAIKSVDTLDAEKSFLMKLDLPVPQKCVLSEEAVGGTRTCYFEGGQIVQQITELEKGKLLKMDVIDYQLTGRKWLGFVEAVYEFEELDDGQTKMTRITTYTSELYPRFYWRPLERIGIEQEHDYVFRNLEKDLQLKQ